jgi:hypothetical protein
VDARVGELSRSPTVREYHEPLDKLWYDAPHGSSIFCVHGLLDCY